MFNLGKASIQEQSMVYTTRQIRLSVNNFYLSSEKWNCHIDGIVFKDGNSQIVGLKIQRFAGNVQANILAFLDLSNSGLQLWESFGAGKVKNIVLLAADGNVHVGLKHWYNYLSGSKQSGSRIRDIIEVDPVSHFLNGLNLVDIKTAVWRCHTICTIPWNHGFLSFWNKWVQNEGKSANSGKMKNDKYVTLRTIFDKMTLLRNFTNFNFYT